MANRRGKVIHNGFGAGVRDVEGSSREARRHGVVVADSFASGDPPASVDHGCGLAVGYSGAYAFNVQQPRLPAVQVSHSKRNPAPSNFP